VKRTVAGTGRGMTWPTVTVPGSPEGLAFVLPDPPEPPADEVVRPLYARYKCWTGPELSETDFPPLQWIVPDLVPAGLSLLVGAPKVGKSWAGLDIALAVASGGMALGGIRVEAGAVLFLALEDGPRRLADRQDLLLGSQPPSQRFHAYTDWPKGLDAARAAWQWCADHPEVRLVVVDTLARVRPARMKGGNGYDEDTAALVPWQKLAEHFGIAVVIVHHDRKAGDGGDFVDAVSGTHGLAGVADTTLVLDRARMEDYGRLRLTGRDVTERELVLRRVGPTWMVHDGPMPDPDLGSTAVRIVQWVAEQPKPVGPSAVALALAEPVDNVKRTMARLAETHRLVKQGRGLYRTPVPSVPSVPFGDDE
jgi:hypothetical protein